MRSRGAGRRQTESAGCEGGTAAAEYHHRPSVGAHATHEAAIAPDVAARFESATRAAPATPGLTRHASRGPLAMTKPGCDYSNLHPSRRFSAAWADLRRPSRGARGHSPRRRHLFASAAPESTGRTLSVWTDVSPPTGRVSGRSGRSIEAERPRPPGLAAESLDAKIARMDRRSGVRLGEPGLHGERRVCGRAD